MTGSSAMMPYRKPRRPIPAVGTMRALAGASLTLTAADLFTDLDPVLAAGYVSRIGRESPWAQYAMAVPRRLEPIDVPASSPAASAASAIIVIAS